MDSSSSFSGSFPTLKIDDYLRSRESSPIRNQPTKPIPSDKPKKSKLISFPRIDNDEEIGSLESKSNRVISTGWKVGMVAALLFTTVLVVVTVLATQGVIHSIPDWGVKTLIGVTSSIGGAQLLSIPFLIAYFRKERETRRTNERLHLDQDSTNALKQEEIKRKNAIKRKNKGDPRTQNRISRSASPVNRGQKPRVNKQGAQSVQPITSAEWGTLLTTAPKGNNFYNLDKPDEPIAAASGVPGYLQLPILGSYIEGEPSFDSNTIEMGVKLPAAQIKAFPKRLQNWFKNEKKVECYFLVFNNTGDLQQWKKNLSMHMMALPEYNILNASQPTKQAPDIYTTSNKDGIYTDMEIAMVGSKGLKENPNKKSALQEGKIVKFPQLSMHAPKSDGPRNFMPLLSPNVAQIVIDKKADISSFYIGAKFRGKAVAIHAVVINNNNAGSDGAKLQAAIAKGTVQEFLTELDTQGFSQTDDVKMTFAHPDDLN